MKLWIDDTRRPPVDYIWCQTVDQAKSAIMMYERNMSDDEIIIDLDHDAGAFVYGGGDYIKLLDWLEEKGIVDTGYTFHIHSINPVGVMNMRRIIKKNEWRLI
jgi:hypothetical protein